MLALNDNLGKRFLYVISRANNLLSRRDLNPGYLNQARIWGPKKSTSTLSKMREGFASEASKTSSSF